MLFYHSVCVARLARSLSHQLVSVMCCISRVWISSNQYGYLYGDECGWRRLWTLILSAIHIWSLLTTGINDETNTNPNINDDTSSETKISVSADIDVFIFCKNITIIAPSLTLIVTLTSSLTERRIDIVILRTYVLELIGTIEPDRQIHLNSLSNSRNNNSIDIIINTERDCDDDSFTVSTPAIHFFSWYHHEYSSWHKHWWWYDDQ